MDEESLQYESEDLDLEAFKSLPLIEDTQDLDIDIPNQCLGLNEADSNYLSSLLEDGVSVPPNLLGVEADEHIAIESGSSSWNLIRSAVDTLTDFSDSISLKSFEPEGLEDLLTLDPTDFDAIFQRLPQVETEPEDNLKYSGALIRDIDIAAELVAELNKLDLGQAPESLSNPGIDEIPSANILFDIYPYCQPCQDKPVDISDFDDGSGDTVLLPIVQPADLMTQDTAPKACTSREDDGTPLDFESPNMFHSILSSFTGETNNERVHLGHKETIFGMSFSSCGRFVATASQDSTIRIWTCADGKWISTLSTHSKKYECLRVAWASPYWVQKFQNMWSTSSDTDTSSFILASAGADGVVKVWQSVDDARTWKCLCTLEHFSCHKVDDMKRVEDEAQDKKEEEELPQIYSLQFIDEWRPSQSPILSTNFHSPFCLLTSSDDFIHLWEPTPIEEGKDTSRDQLLMSRIMSIRFTHLDMGFGGVFVLFSGDDSKEDPNTFRYPQVEKELASSSRKAYGGLRNPDNLVYVFDASYCPSNCLLGVALSDGSLRLVNGRGSCVFVLQLSEIKARLTSFAWDSSGHRLASCVASGQIILWSIISSQDTGLTQASCYAVLEGGHTRGRPLYGVRYLGTENQDFLVSWGIDGKLCLWAANIGGNVTAPLAILVSKPEYPIYAADVTEVSPTDNEQSSLLGRIGIAGGGDGGFIGVPFYLYDIMN